MVSHRGHLLTFILFAFVGVCGGVVYGIVWEGLTRV